MTTSEGIQTSFGRADLADRLRQRASAAFRQICCGVFRSAITALGKVKQTAKRDGTLVFAVKTIKNTETTNRINRFSYNSANGKLSVSLSGLTLDALTTGETHLTVELTIRDRIYTTGVTFFGANPGRYSTSMP